MHGLKIYTWITSVILGIWLYIAIGGIRAYNRLMKSDFSADARIKWKRKARKISLTGLLQSYFFYSSNDFAMTIGFKD
jgi:hypothetical protein